MAKKINGVVAEFLPDNLFASSVPTAIVGMIKLKKGQGILKRGSVIAKDSGGDYVLLADSTTAAYVLTDNVDTSVEPVVGPVYKTGHFIGDALIAADGHELSAEDKENLRSVGILVSDGIGYKEEE